MKIRVLGAGIYGCHIASALLNAGHDVEVHETKDRIFSGASGSIPARLHTGQHYPRSGLTRAACLEHYAAFMRMYAALTSGVRTNIYAIAEHDSLVDFSTYCKILAGEIEYIRIEQPSEYGLRNVEGAMLTGERHVVVSRAIKHFESVLAGRIQYGAPSGVPHDRRFDWTVDCTFCANGSAGVDRYEPCLTVILEGPTDWAVTIMDGPFGSVYAWDEDRGLSSLTSSKFTPFARVPTWEEANSILQSISADDVGLRAEMMFEQMRYYWPQVEAYRIVGHKLSIRAMPKSGADARLVDVVKVDDRTLRVRAGKIDAVVYAEQLVKEAIA